METYSFAARLTRIEGTYLHYILVIPDDIIEKINKPGRVRVKGTMNGAPFALAIQNLKTGEKYFSIGNPLRRAAKIQLSVPVKVEFHIVDENQLDMPEELTAVLEQDTEGKAVFESLTIGYKRSLIYYITSVKNVDSRVKRAIEIIDKAKHRKLHGQRKTGDE